MNKYNTTTYIVTLYFDFFIVIVGNTEKPEIRWLTKYPYYSSLLQSYGIYRKIIVLFISYLFINGLEVLYFVTQGVYKITPLIICF